MRGRYNVVPSDRHADEIDHQLFLHEISASQDVKKIPWLEITTTIKEDDKVRLAEEILTAMIEKEGEPTVN